MTQQPVPSPGRRSRPVPTGDRLAAAPTCSASLDDRLGHGRQRLGEWLTTAPQIEEDMALANVSLDLFGQARGLYAHVGELDGSGRSEDDFAILAGRAVVEQRPPRRAGASRLRVRDGPTARALDLPGRAVCGSGRFLGRDLPRCGGEGDQGGRLPPGPRPPVGGAAGDGTEESHPPDAGGPRRRTPLCSPSCSTTTSCPTAATRRVHRRAAVLAPRRGPRALGRGAVDDAPLIWPVPALAGARWPSRSPLRRDGSPPRRDAACGPFAPGRVVTALRIAPSEVDASVGEHPRPRAAGRHHRPPRHPPIGSPPNERPASSTSSSPRPTRAARRWRRSPRTCRRRRTRRRLRSPSQPPGAARPGPPTG